MSNDPTLKTTVTSPPPFLGNSVYPPYMGQWPPPLRVVVREGAVALTVPEIVSLVQEGIITAERAAELLGFKP